MSEKELKTLVTAKLPKAKGLHMVATITDKNGIDLFGKKIVTVELDNGLCMKFGDKEPILKKLSVGRTLEILATSVASDSFVSSSGRAVVAMVLQGIKLEDITESEAVTKFSGLKDDDADVDFRNIEEMAAAKKARSGEGASGTTSTAQDMSAIMAALAAGPKSE